MLLSELEPRPLANTAASVLLTRRSSFTRLLGRMTRLRIRFVHSELPEWLADHGRRLGGVGGGARTGCRWRVFAGFLTHFCVAQFPRLLEFKAKKIKAPPYYF